MRKLPITIYQLRWKLIAAFIALLLSACLQSSDCSRKEVFCAALVTDTQGIDDHGINQDAWAGLQESKAEGGVNQIASIASVDTRDYEKNIAYFADKGYDVVITTGAGMRGETLNSANRFKDSIFIGFNQPQKKTRPNLIPVAFAEDQMGFLAGVLAARISKTGEVGAVCDIADIDSMWRYCEGFRAGVKYADKNIRAMVLYRENGNSDKLFIDEAWGREASQSLIARGADVIFAAGGVTSQGALRAALEAQVKAIGAERDQAAALSHSTNSSVATSIYGDAKSEVKKEMQILKGGNIGGRRLSPFKFLPLSQKFPENLTTELNDLLAGLLSGKIKTNVTSSKP
jgi:basic membrane protein A